MLYLYLGYLLGQSYTAVQVMYHAQISFMALIFSIIVFLIWTFFPVLPYGAAKLMGARNKHNGFLLFAVGVSVSLLEKLLAYSGLLDTQEAYPAMAMAGVCFFLFAWIAPFRRLSLSGH